MAKKDQFESFMDAYSDNNRTISKDVFLNEKTSPEADLSVEQKKKLHAARTVNSGRKKNNGRSTKHQVNFKVEEALWSEFQEMCLSEGIAYSEALAEGMKRMIEEHRNNM